MVRVRACTLCRSDLHTFTGRRTEPTPLVLGHEIVGELEAVAEGDELRDAVGIPVAIGDRISWPVVVGCGSCVFCRDDLPQKCQRLVKYGHQAIDPSRPTGGGLADWILLSAGTRWLAVPAGVSDGVAAMANCATATIAGLLRLSGDVRGRSVAVFGAGILGLNACALFRSAGADRVLAIDPLDVCRERSLAFGATDTCVDDPSSIAASVAQITDGLGVDIALELAGSSAMVSAALLSTRIGGRVLLAGTVALTPAVAFDPEQIVRRCLTIQGSHNYHPRDLAAALSFLAGPAQSYPFESLIAATFPLDQVALAFEQASQHPGQRVLVHP
jgi:alcohol dehydrogenase